MSKKDGGRAKTSDDLAETIRSHYDRLERIAEDVERLGYDVAAKILSEAMPQTAKSRSGDLEEILATELVEEAIGLRVPVRRLRYKDGRNMAMRGDDFIGAGYHGKGEKLWLLKGEAKSNKTLGKATVTSARISRNWRSAVHDGDADPGGSSVTARGYCSHSRCQTDLRDARGDASLA
jgi:hypothetical protein